MTPREYEQLVAQHFKVKGYDVEMTPYSNDYGIDVIATKGNERLAIQAKMFGNTARKINRQMVMELHGAKDFVNCTRAVIATDGVLTADAQDVAKALGMEILSLSLSSSVTLNPIPTHDVTSPTRPSGNANYTFDDIWSLYIKPLEGKTLKNSRGKSNHIVTVDWSGVKRITSNEKPQHIKIEIFRWAVGQILQNGSITRKRINEEYTGRASSGIVLVLSQVPLFEAVSSPSGIRLRA